MENESTKQTNQTNQPNNQQINKEWTERRLTSFTHIDLEHEIIIAINYFMSFWVLELCFCVGGEYNRVI